VKIKNHALFIICVGLSNLPAQSQDSVYARHIIARFSSNRFHGRGYVKKGNQKAANYIAREFRNFHLESYTSNYFQEFPINVNTFPSKAELSLNGKALIAGKDYLVDPASVSAIGNYSVRKISMRDINDVNKIRKFVLEFPNCALWIDDRKDSIYLKNERILKPLLLNALAGLPENSCPAVIISSPGKLTWTIDGYIQSVPFFTLAKGLTYDSIFSVRINIRNKFLQDFKTRNVIAYIKGNIKPDSVVMITAHYDHLGMMGNTAYFPGANDNASGVAMLLSLARYYSNPIHKPRNTMVFLALSAEELGLKGSQYFTEYPMFDLKTIKFLINIDMAGNGDQGITVVNGTIYHEKFDRLQQINNEFHLLKQVKMRGEACNSDHCPFYRKGVPCFFIYTMGGVPYYHDVFDRSETLPLSTFSNYFNLLSKFIDSL
jgi:aminopeptidase YwaD